MQHNSSKRFGWLLTTLLVIGSLVLAWFRLGGLPIMGIYVGPDLKIRSLRAEDEPAEEVQSPIQRGDHLVAIGGQGVEDLRDVRAVLKHVPFSNVEGVLSSSVERMTFQTVRPMHRFSVTLQGGDPDPTALPPGVEPTDRLVEVDGRPLPGAVGPEGVRSIMASRPEALLGFQRENAVFTGNLKLTYSPYTYGFVLSFLLALLFVLGLWKFHDSRLDPGTPLAVGVETICFAWVTLLAFQYQWVLADPVIATGVVAGLVMVRPTAFIARARSAEEDAGTGAWLAAVLSSSAAVVLAVLMFRGVLANIEQALHFAGIVGLLYIVYEIIAGLARGKRTTFGERGGYLAGIIVLSFLVGVFAYFADPVAFVEDQWLWFAVIVLSLVWFGDVLYCFRGPATTGFADIAVEAGRRKVITEYLRSMTHEMPGTRLELVVYRDDESASLELVAGSVLEANPTDAKLHDAMAILVQENTRVPLSDSQDRHTNPMAGIAQTMNMTIAMNFAPPVGSIELPDTYLILVGFQEAQAGEPPAYASTETLEKAQRELSAQTWTAAVVEAMAVFSTETEVAPVEDEEKAELRREVEELESELASAHDSVEGLRRDRTDLAAHADIYATQVRRVEAPDRETMHRLLEPELVEAFEYLLDSGEPILIGGPPGCGKSFAAWYGHEIDESFPGPMAVFDAAAGASFHGIGESIEFPDRLLDACVGGALLLRSAWVMNDDQLLYLVRKSHESFRLFLCVDDRDAEERSVLEGRSEALRDHLEHREVVIPPFARRQSIMPDLFQYFVEEAALRHRKEVVGISVDAMELLVDYGFPGQVEEARAMIHAAVARAPGEVLDADDLRLG